MRRERRRLTAASLSLALALALSVPALAAGGRSADSHGQSFLHSVVTWLLGAFDQPLDNGSIVP